MYKHSTYRAKFSLLQEWVPSIIQQLKRDLKNEHLSKNGYFVRKFLGGKPLSQLTVNELADAYHRAIQEEEKGEELAEFITARWLLRNQEMYQFFEDSLKQIDPAFDTLETLALEQAQPIVDESVRRFGPTGTYVFSVLNSVVFPSQVFEQLKQAALAAKQAEAATVERDEEQESLLRLNQNLERELSRLQEKQERKLSTLQKQHQVEVEGLKKQIAQLQRKVHDQK